jgi:homoserine dehydrogenase
MKHYKLAFLGFGNVGQALARLLIRKQEEIKDKYAITFSAAAIATGSRGRAIDPDGIDLNAALKLLDGGQPLDSLSTVPAPQDNLAFLKACGADVLFENTPVSYTDGQPALDHLMTALQLGMHAFTANKGPVVHGFRQLKALAEEKGKKFFFESTVMDGAPVFGLFRDTLPAAQVNAIHGVLNSTTNLILTRMEDGETFDQAVAYAQSIGIAETDPGGDIDGWDAAVKISALITVLMDTPFTPDRVDRRGIREITPEQIAAAQADGKRWKLVCSAVKEDGKILASVAPKQVTSRSLMYTIDGTTSIVTIRSDVLGDLSLVETDPGPHTTAYGLLADFLNAARAD